MNLNAKINMNIEGIIENGAITIVAFGDSVTHGMLKGEMNYETVYHNRLKNKINAINPMVPVNVINAGIGGITAKDSLKRMERDVLCHNPDLVIICFGLNDINGELSEYIDSLSEMFKRCKERDFDVIFLTPNMLNSYVDENTPPFFKEYAQKCADIQNNGTMDLYIGEAVKLANSMDVKVCDCYKEWKKLSETQDTTLLLCNRLNHPTKEMHELFADMLFKTIFGDNEEIMAKYNSLQ